MPTTMPNNWTPRNELTGEQRHASNNQKRDSYNERKANERKTDELKQQLDIKDKEVAASNKVQDIYLRSYF